MMLLKFIQKYGILMLVALGLVLRLVAAVTHFGSSLDVITIIIAVGALLPLVYEIVTDVMEGTFGVDVIALIGIVASLLLHEYTTALIILLMLSGGEVLEDYALSRAQDGIAHLIRANPTEATVVEGDHESTVPVGQVAIGTLILVKQHQIIPLDGIVVRGSSLVDESKLTGESVLVEKKTDSLVLSGSMNSGGPLYIETTKLSHESTYQNIINLVMHAQQIKPRFIRIADRYSVVFTLITFVVAGFAYWLTGQWHSVLLVLVVATPCPLILAAPTAFASCMSMLAGAGLMVQNPDSIERLARARVFLFDKTGTLTYGVPKLHDIEPYEQGLSTDNLVKLLFSVEKFSPHILADSIAAYAREHSITSHKVTDFHEELGQGVSGVVEGSLVKCGKYSFAASDANSSEPERVDDKMYVYVSRDGVVIGRVSLIDEVRPSMIDFITRLKKLAPVVALVSGDKRDRTEKIAAQVGIETVEAECLPADKLTVVEKYIASHGEVVMVGDGINDAPALARAGVGVVIGSGTSNVATQNGGMVITGDDPVVLLYALRVTRRTMIITKQSIFVGLGLSVVLMCFGVAGLYTPVQGALMQEVIDVIVIVNALRVRLVV